MSSHQYEIEIKALLGSEDKVTALVEKMHDIDPAVRLLGGSSQLNHYFIGGDIGKIFQSIAPLVEADRVESFRKVLYEGKNISVRTRQADTAVFFVVKASIDDTTSSNGTARIEFEAELSDITLDELDQLLLYAGCTYQAKWSRVRKEYAFKGIVVCIDRNAGYGYIAEFEKIVHDDEEAEAAKKELRDLMKTLEIEELPQDRLARMFAYYNEHWMEYYGTDKIFNIA